MITEDYCSQEVAKLLDKKGFREYCEAIYFILENGDYRWSKIDIPIRDCSTCKPTAILCPTHQMAMKWLRDVYDIHISVNRTFLINDIDNKPYLVYVCTKKCHTSYNAWSEYHSTYEEAVEAALKYSLKNLIYESS